MSYGFNIYFHGGISSKEEALKFANDYTQVFRNKDNIRRLIESEMFYLPSSRVRGSYDYGNVSGFYMDKYWLRMILSAEFVYWPEYELLGLVGDWNTIENTFGKGVYFQNSCDQDYEETTWKGICTMFDEVLESPENLYYEHFDEDDEPSDKQYVRRTNVYKTIFNKLDLDSFMWRRSDFSNSKKDVAKRKFETFVLNFFRNEEEVTDISQNILTPLVISDLGPLYHQEKTSIFVETDDGIAEYEISYPLSESGKASKDEIVNKIVKNQIEKHLAAGTFEKEGIRALCRINPTMLKCSEIRLVGIHKLIKKGE